MYSANFHLFGLAPLAPFALLAQLAFSGKASISGYCLLA